MPTTAAPPSTAEVTAETPCVHCGLPVGRRPVVHGERPFCCSSCALVYDALRDAGFSDTYYRLRDDASVKPAEGARTSDLVLAEMDSTAFLDEHTTLLDDGTRRATLFLDGVHCAACVWLVERMPFEVEGALETRLDLPRARLDVRWNPDAVPLSELARWLARFGYAAHPARREGESPAPQAERRLLLRLGAAWALAGNVMLLAFATYSGLDYAADPLLAGAGAWLSLVLATLSMIVGGSVFFRRAWQSSRSALKARSLRVLHMDTPIAIGLAVGYASSAYAVVVGSGHVWFDSLTVLIAALLTARWLQLRSRRLAGDASERLLALLPTVAQRITDEDVETVPVKELVVGDVVVVRTGETIPADGVVVHGESAVNNAVLTGESRPEVVAEGARVSAGATNERAVLRVRVVAAGDESRVGRLLAWVRDAEAGRAPVVLLADRLGGWFVATVLTLAALTAVVWLVLDPSEAVTHTVAFLVITCPCALGMATPLAMAVSAGRAARAGLFVKTDAATEALTRVDVVVLDKTGTLTEGRMTLADWEGSDDVLDLAAALEQASTHPLATALVRARSACDLGGTTLPEPVSVHAEAGSGLAGWVDERAVRVGRPDWVEAHAEGLDAFRPALARFAEEGFTPVAVAVDGEVRAALAFGDRVHPDADASLRALEGYGCEVYVLSGDHPQVVGTVAARLDLDDAQARGGALPEDKLAFVERLQAEGRTVMMVGDGVNDAAALQQADVGVAVGGGATASMVAADVFLTREGLTGVVQLLGGSRVTMRTIRRSLGVSLGYNVVAGGAAMLGLVGPLVAAVAMPLSSLFVVALSVLQRPFRSTSLPPAR